MVRTGDTADGTAERTSSSWTALAAALAFTVAPAMARAQTPPPSPEAPPSPTAPPSAPASNATQTTPSEALVTSSTAAPAQDDLVVLEADTLINDDIAHTVTAEGDVQVRHQGRTMRADRLVYNLDTGAVTAEGNVEIVNADGTATYAERVEADDGLNVAVATELRARIGENGALAARSAVRHGPGESELSNIIYTSCPICENSDRPPTWSLRARRAIQDRNSRTISYRGAVLDVAGVPVLYLPFFAHPDPSVGRASGFLPPDFGRDSRLGTYYQQPYYWAISPSQDATLSAQVNSHVHPLLGLEYRKQFFSGAFEAQTYVTHEQNFDSRGDTFGDQTYRSSLFAKGRFELSDYWDWGFGAERVADSPDGSSSRAITFLSRYDLRGPGDVRGPYIGDQTRLISQLYAIGQDEDSYSSVSFVSFQGLRANDSSTLLPLILPFAEYDGVFEDPVFGGQLRFQANTAVLQRSDFDAGSSTGDSARISVAATWRDDVVFGPGMVFAPFAQARGDYFREETSEDQFESFGRGLGYAGAEVSWPFMRPGQSFDLVIEPVVMAAYGVDETNDTRIQNEDSLSFEFDDSSLFRPNAAPNYDLWEPGGRITTGIRASARAHTGESASLIFGRRWRDEASPDFSAASNLAGEKSDWVGAFDADLGRNFATEVRFRLDDDTLALQRLDVGARAAWNRFTGSLRYYSIDEMLTGADDPSEELSGAVGVQLVRGWRAEFGLRRDLDSDINLRQEIRAIYEDDCTFLEIAYTRSETQFGTLGPSEGLQIRIGLRSLGVLGGG